MTFATLQAAAEQIAPSPEAQTEELYNLRSKYGQRKKAISFCSSQFTTSGEVRYCLNRLLKNVKFHTM
eukprot:CAMPEP_0117049616 /NCGR_PEP_ID=MMETSP0472-20121206/34255_1 /TAXON_ID=693140 ORGANISM="Tiarina fusus, Strain LIS" /NCGR_SAMPLE_ID=MMETSP0472 /ASSEMBLY_ACC=CAM_ASM_000603 /LENGTH=67 /DNA_ID=CAMNT_0004763081 /DNA_START=13 /DNA_END=216 /DNA_ORIENTATION=-